MVTQSIMKEAVSFLGGNGNQSQAKSADTGFGRVMDQNLGNSRDIKSSQKQPDAADRSSGDRTYGKGTDTSKVQERQAEQKDNKAVDRTGKSENAVDAAGQLKEAPSSKEEELAKMEELASQLGIQIADIVKQVLGIPKEELEGVLEELGMQMTDLLKPDNLNQLVLAVYGTQDISQLLTNEEMALDVTQLTDMMNEIELDPEAGITKEELGAFLEKALQNPVAQQNPSGPASDTASKDMQTVTEQEAGKTSADVSIQVENQTDNSSEKTGSNLSQEGRAQDSGKTEDTLVNDFVRNLAQVTEQNLEGLSEQSVRLNQMKEIVTQIVDKIKVMIKPDLSSMEIQLNPENLGKVNLSVVAKNGIMTATFAAENQIVKEALENQLQILKDNLNNQGIKVEAIEVTVSNFSFNQSSQADAGGSQQKGNSRKPINLNEADFTEEDLTEEELLAARVLEQNGGSVDYTA